MKRNHRRRGPTLPTQVRGGAPFTFYLSADDHRYLLRRMYLGKFRSKAATIRSIFEDSRIVREGRA